MKKIIFFLAALWEMVRFVVVYLTVAQNLNPMSEISTNSALLIIMAPELTLVLAFIVAGTLKSLNYGLTRILGGAKVIMAITAFFHLLAQILFGATSLGLSLQLTLVIFLLDLIFAVILLLLKVPVPGNQTSQQSGELPEFNETRIEE